MRSKKTTLLFSAMYFKATSQYSQPKCRLCNNIPEKAHTAVKLLYRSIKFLSGIICHLHRIWQRSLTVVALFLCCIMKPLKLFCYCCFPALPGSPNYFLWSSERSKGMIPFPWFRRCLKLIQYLIIWYGYTICILLRPDFTSLLSFMKFVITTLITSNWLRYLSHPSCPASLKYSKLPGYLLYHNRRWSY